MTSNITHTATVNRVKASINFTQPSYNSMKNVLAVRLHLDNNTLKNGPLNVLAGTHELGILKAEEITALNKQSAITVTGARGSVMVMRPLLVHASSKALQPDNRRVLHFLYV